MVQSPLSPSSSGGETVQVVLRCRPLSQKELNEGHERIIDVDVKNGVVEITNPKAAPGDPPKQFTFDAVYDSLSKQKVLYEETFRPLVDSVLQGYNGTIFAYGQTGTGKTFTMEGVRQDPELRGVIPNAFEHIFSYVSSMTHVQYLVRASYLEIYQEEIRDLLSKDQTKKLELRESPDTGVYVKDLSSYVCKSEAELETIMSLGNQNRSVGATNMNEHSSRSHAIFIITVESSERGLEGKNRIKVGKLNLVDLAGSERQSKTGATGDRFKEATKINLSLSALGNVISALVDGKSTHIPYRDSKLTRLLQDSLGGNARTVMVANIGPASYNYDETLTTLRYASRAKMIKNIPKINEDPKDALLRQYQDEIARLKSYLESKRERSGNRERRRRVDYDSDDSGATSDPEVMYEAERDAIMGNSQLLEEEKNRLLKEIEVKVAELRKHKEEQRAIQEKIKTIEEKLIGGNETVILKKTAEQQRDLELKRQELIERQNVEREMRRHLQLEEEGADDLMQTYASLQQEVEAKTKRLKKLVAKFKAAKQEIVDLGEEYAREREELEVTLEQIIRELKLKYLILEHFVPREERERLVRRVGFDDENDRWVLQSPSLFPPLPRLMAVPHSKFPMTQAARMMSLREDSLHVSLLREENVLRLSLSVPRKRTKDYLRCPARAASRSVSRASSVVRLPESVGHEPTNGKSVDAFLRAAIKEQRSKSRHGRPPSSFSHHPQFYGPDVVSPSTIHYPLARGLVPK